MEIYLLIVTTFILGLLIGNLLLSLHWKRRYEELKEWIKLKREIGEIR